VCAGGVLLTQNACATISCAKPVMKLLLVILRSILKDKDRWPRYMAARSLEDLGEKALDAVKDRAVSLNDDDSDVRDVARRALQRMGTKLPR